MKYSIFFLMLFSIQIYGQDLLSARITFDALDIEHFDGIQSCAVADYQDYIIAIGGRKEGMHAINPADAFKMMYNNDSIALLDKNTFEIKQRSLVELDTNLQKQLQSTNMLNYQDGKHLLLVGGYAQDYRTEFFETYPFLTVVNLEILVNSILNDLPIVEAFQQIKDDRFFITGGEMKSLGEEYLMVGGMQFMGIYNGFGMPSFDQEYTNQIRIFKVNTFEPLSITFTDSYYDADNLHRRDFNLLNHINPQGEEALLLSAGVFQYKRDIPWLNPVLINRREHITDTTFTQVLSHYHSSHLSFYSKCDKKMSHLFLGGIAEYYFEEEQLVIDTLVPFVNTISLMTQDSTGKYLEYNMKVQMPGYLGAGARFILNPEIPLYSEGIIDLDKMKKEKQYLGFIFGGIESDVKHPFFDRKKKASRASDKVYKVYVEW